MKSIIKKHFQSIFAISLLFATIVSACASPAGQAHPPGGKLRVVATTTIVADVVKQIGGDKIELTTLLPSGVDPHAFDPTPQDVAKLAGAQVIFANGAGLETFLDPLLLSAGAQDKVVYVSDGIQLLKGAPELDEPTPAGGQIGDDPHVWSDPNNVMIWVNNIEAKLSALDAQDAGIFKANAAAYRQQLKDLDGWVREQVALVPPANRLIVSDHLVFAYFAHQYGFTQVGALIPAYSSMAQPSAQDIANLEDVIHKQGVKAIFVGKSINPSIAERVAQDTGIQLIFVYTGSLSAPGGEAGSYLDYVRHNVNAIVGALK
jgi:manganese/iron transport system substrate-binding protein